jgi:HSP20 family protein
MLSLYRPLTSLLRDEFGNDDWSPFASSSLTRARSFTPAVDVLERDDAYVLKAEVPGLSPEQIELQVENDVLTFRGEQKSEQTDERNGYRRIERSYGSFARSFVLPQGTNVDNIEANVENGVLTVKIPKVQAATPRKLQIKSGGGIVDKAKKIFGKPNENKPNENVNAS